MAEGNVVGSAEFELRATRKKLADDLRQSERDVKGFMDRVEGDANRSAKSVGNSFGGVVRSLTIGITALTAVLAAGLAMALKFGQASLKMADDMANSARRIGMSTTALQEWQYVARKTGSTATEAGSALEAFAAKWEQAQAGLSKQAGDAFKALGFQQEDLRRFASAEEALDAVVDRIGDLSSASDRAAIAEKLGLGALVPALREGSDEVARLRDEAAALGFVMDEELIRKGAEAQGKLEDLTQVIGIQMAEAFINLSDEVLAFTQVIADALKGLNDFIGKFDAWKRSTDEAYGPGWTDKFLWRDAPGALRDAWNAETSGRAGAMRRAAKTPNGDEDDPAVTRQLIAQLDASAGRRNRASSSGRTSLTPVQPRGRSSGNSAQREAEREARRAERVEQEIFRARQRALGIFDREALTVQERFDIEQAQVKLEREAEQKQLESRLARKDISAKEYEQLKLINDQTATLEDRVASDILARDLADERLAQERMLSDLTADLLSLQSGAARTAKERREIELRLLAMAQQRARDERENDPKFRQLSPQRQQAIRDEQERVFGLQRDAVNRANLSPLDAWRDQSLKSIAEVREAYQSVAARGLDALNAGIVDAIINTRDLGEVFSNVAKQMMADIVSIGIRRNLTEPLAEMLFGGGGGGGAKAAARAAKGIGGGSSNWLSKIFSAGRSFLGFSEGGFTGAGGKHEPAGLVHKGEYVLPQEAVSRIGLARLEAMRFGNLPGYAEGGLVGLSLPSFAPAIGGLAAVGAGRSAEPVVFDMRGAFVPETFMREVEQKVAAGEARAYGRAMNDAPKLTMSQTARQQRQAVGRQRRGS